ncbi:MAG: phosphopantothenoylcysteine decarboxylase [Methylothermaceae bacteria B42]|nr:MAG: phosphopantothenoylcysteine decarboxylase [Methylothermaceae bacteria B42]HHJ39923.1 bifunctional phosphopantothenoylcysteine decarboxylase/phosphopantothenate--cysteine ligase CoaBC [Methylothermaceae bacterium]
MNQSCRGRIVLGVTGGIAAYKSAELARLLRRRGDEVQVVMTEAATRFVTPMTFQALSGRSVRTSLWDEASEAAMGHIELARWADRILVAPASADFLAKLNAGLADDLLATLCLVAECPLLVAPAMNCAMWRHPATQANVNSLRQRGVEILGPAEGEQACGETGPGRMLEPAEILAYLDDGRQTGQLQGVKVLITAGPTREAIDPVRYISNRSSGKMGYALAQAAHEAGAVVTLISGPTALQPPAAEKLIPVESAAEMYHAVMNIVEKQDIFISAAAVADYAPLQKEENKVKKQTGPIQLALVPTTDILATVTKLDNKPFSVGFAAETQSLEQYAKDKLVRKNLDMIAANLVGEKQGFEVDENALHVFWPGGETRLPLASKLTLARRLIGLIAERYEAQNSTENSR